MDDIIQNMFIRITGKYSGQIHPPRGGGMKQLSGQMGKKTALKAKKNFRAYSNFLLNSGKKPLFFLVACENVMGITQNSTN